MLKKVFPIMIVGDYQWKYEYISVYDHLSDGTFSNNTGGAIIFCSNPLTRWSFFAISDGIISLSQYAIENGKCCDIEDVMNMAEGSNAINEHDYIMQYYNWKIYQILAKLIPGKTKVDDFLSKLVIKNEEKFVLFSQIQLDKVYWEKIIPKNKIEISGYSSYEHKYFLIQKSYDPDEYENIWDNNSVKNINRKHWFRYDYSGGMLIEKDSIPDDNKYHTFVIPKYDEFLLCNFYEHIYNNPKITIKWSNIIWLIENIKKLWKNYPFYEICWLVNFGKIEEAEDNPVEIINQIIELIGKIKIHDILPDSIMFDLLNLYVQKRQINIDVFDIDHMNISEETDKLILWFFDKINENKIICAEKQNIFVKLPNKLYGFATKSALLTRLGL